jgi:hypothetical protein
MLVFSFLSAFALASSVVDLDASNFDDVVGKDQAVLVEVSLINPSSLLPGAVIASNLPLSMRMLVQSSNSATALSKQNHKVLIAKV